MFLVVGIGDGSPCLGSFLVDQSLLLLLEAEEAALFLDLVGPQFL